MSVNWEGIAGLAGLLFGVLGLARGFLADRGEIAYKRDSLEQERAVALIDDYDQLRQALRDEIARLERQIATRDAVMCEMQERIQRLTEALEYERQEHERERQAREQMQCELDQLRLGRDRMQAEIDQLRRERAELRLELDEMKSNYCQQRDGADQKE